MLVKISSMGGNDRKRKNNRDKGDMAFMEVICFFVLLSGILYIMYINTRFNLCASAGYGLLQKSFYHDGQHDGRHEKQNGGHAQKLCKSHNFICLSICLPLLFVLSWDFSWFQENLPSDSHAFSSSSVMTYSKVGEEPAKVFQASTQTRSAPGGVSTN